MAKLVERLQKLESDDISILHNVLYNLEAPYITTSREISALIDAVVDEFALTLGDRLECIRLVFEFIDAAEDSESESTPAQELLQSCQEAGILLANDLQSEIDDDVDSGELQTSRSVSVLALMEQRAMTFDRAKLLTQSVEIWQTKTRLIQEMERAADVHWRRKLMVKTVTHWGNLCRIQQARKEDLERREDAFDKWLNLRAARKMLLKWVMEHRLISFQAWEQRRLLQSALNIWRDKTDVIRAQEQEASAFRRKIDAKFAMGKLVSELHKRRAEKSFEEHVNLLRLSILARKWLLRWKNTASKRSKARYENEMRDRFVFYEGVRAERTVASAMQTWASAAKEQRASRLAMEAMADEFKERHEKIRARRSAHQTLVKWYALTAQSHRSRERADETYRRNLFERLGTLDLSGPWRGQTRKIKEMESTADEYREIRDQQAALKALKTWRAKAFTLQRRAEDADALYARHTRNHAIGYLQHWRSETAQRRGTQLATMPPVTPAARRSQMMTTTPALTPATRIPRMTTRTS